MAYLIIVLRSAVNITCRINTNNRYGFFTFLHKLIVNNGLQLTEILAFKELCLEYHKHEYESQHIKYLFTILLS